jgi:hypothetical protein
MGGFENYGADDLYNMEDVWNEKPFKHKVITNKSWWHPERMYIPKLKSQKVP